MPRCASWTEKQHICTRPLPRSHAYSSDRTRSGKRAATHRRGTRCVPNYSSCKASHEGSRKRAAQVRARCIFWRISANNGSCSPRVCWAQLSWARVQRLRNHAGRQGGHSVRHMLSGNRANILQRLSQQTATRLAEDFVVILFRRSIFENSSSIFHIL